MFIAILGYGKVGRLHAKALNRAGHELLIVDPVWPSAFTDVSRIPISTAKRVDLWTIATPTCTHLEILRAVLSRNASARVLLEKPAVRPGEFAPLNALRERFGDARLAIHDTYGFSPVTHSLIRHLRAQPGADRLLRLEVEMSKNRRRDEERGRFVDSEWGPSGYEGFHLLSLRRRLTGAFAGEVREVRLLTSVDGTLTLRPELLVSAFTPAARAMIGRGHISYGSEFRYRLVKGVFASGLKFELAFEPGFDPTNLAYKNSHVLAWREGGNGQSVRIEGDHFAFSLRKQIEQLCANVGPRWPTRLEADHRLGEIAVQACTAIEKVVV